MSFKHTDIVRRSRTLSASVALCAFLLVSGPVAGTETVNPRSPFVGIQSRVEQALAHRALDEQLRNLSDVGETLTLDEIPGALELAAGLPKLRERGVLREATLKRWARLAPEQAFPFVAALPESRGKAETLRYAATRLALLNAPAAANTVLEIPAGRSRSEAIQGIAETWARTDPQEALKWVSTLPPGEAREGSLHEVRFIWVHSDPIGAARHVTATVPAGNIKNALLTNIAVEWAQLDPHAALAWADSLTHATERNLVLARASESWSDRDPAPAAQFALGLKPAALRIRAVVAVAERWATQDPKAAADFAAALNDPDLRQSALASVMRLWTAVSPTEAGQWIERLQPGAAKEESLPLYLEAVAPWAPDSGLHLVAREAPELAASPGAEACARKWLALDFAVASQWIAEAKLPEELKAKWCSPIHP